MFAKIVIVWAGLIAFGLLGLVLDPPKPKSEAQVVYERFQSAFRDGQEEACAQTLKWRREHGRICVGKPN